MKLFRRDIVIITLFSCVIFGGIYAYYIGMFEPKHSEELLMPPMNGTSSSRAIIVKPENLPLDQRSTTYRNERFGYSVVYPTYLLGVANCDYDPYPPAGYPVTVMEDGDSSFITATFYAYAKYKDEDSYEYVCTNVHVTLDTIKQDMSDKLWYYYGWQMVGQKNIANDTQLLAFIRKWYGSTCEIEAKHPTDQPGVFDIEISGDTDDLAAETSTCPLNFGYALKYSPSRQTAVTWKIGQDGRFDDLDYEMMKSFRFE